MGREEAEPPRQHALIMACNKGGFPVVNRHSRRGVEDHESSAFRLGPQLYFLPSGFGRSALGGVFLSFIGVHFFVTVAVLNELFINLRFFGVGSILHWLDLLVF